VQTFDNEFEKIKTAMRDDNGLDNCVIEQFKDLDGPRILALCSLLEHQVPVLKEALAKAYDLTAKNVDVTSQVGFASSNDRFRVSHFSTLTNSVQKMVI